MCFSLRKTPFLRIFGYINHTLGFLLGPSNVSMVFDFLAISFFVWMRLLWTLASALGPLPYICHLSVKADFA